MRGELHSLDLKSFKDYKYLGGLRMALDKESLIDLICKHCEFYKESDKDLECGAYKILKGLLEKGAITPEEIEDVLRK
jgi:hypothetical protein